MTFQVHKKLKIPRFTQAGEFNGWERLLEFFPGAVFIFNSKLKRICYANASFEALSAYPIENLADLDIERVIPNFEAVHPDQSAGKEPPEKQLSLLKPDQTQVIMTAQVLPLDNSGTWWLVKLAHEDSHRQQQKDLDDRFWEIFLAFYNAAQMDDIQEALTMVMSATVSLVGAEAICIYQADSEELELNLSARHGDCQAFPKKLAPQELVNLREVTTWTRSKRSISTLHRLARAQDWTYLTSLPIGEANATIGLFVLAGKQQESTGVDLPRLQWVVNYVAALIQKHSQLSAMRQANQELELRAKLYQNIEESLEVGIVLLTPDFNIVELNPAAEVMLGYSSQETYDQPGAKIIIGDHEFASLFSQDMQNPGKLETPAYRLYRRSGKGFPAAIKTFPLIVDNAIRGWGFTFQDRSQEENMKTEIKHMEHMAALGKFQTSFAHEVRNPINNISTGLQYMALNLSPDDPNQDAISRLKQDCDRLSDLMNTILSYTWTSQNEMAVVDLGQMVNRVIERFKPKHIQANIKQHVQIDPSLSQVWGNRRALEQVYVNLIDNATRVMKENGGTLAVKITNSITPEKTEIVEASIGDTGPGIPKEEQERLFHPYFTTNPNGTGLGLYICGKIIDAHRGRIDMDSFPGGGTIFYIRIPAYKMEDKT